MARKKLLVMFFAVMAAVPAAFVVFAQAPQTGRGGRGQQPPMAIKQVKPNVYMVTGNGGNSTVRVTDEGVILVDTKNLGEQFYNELLGQIKTVTPQPVKYAFMTHVHQDHSGNGGRFVQAGAQVIAHEGLKRNLEVGGPNGKGYESNAGKPEPPSVTYTSEREVRLGNVRAVARHWTPGHTAGDTIVYFPNDRIVALGDHFVAAQPNCDYPMGGSILQWSQSLAEILKLDFDVAIPGHGNDPLTKADVTAFHRKIDAIGKKAVELARNGTPKEKIRAEIQAQIPDLGWQMTGVVNDQRLDAFYEEVSKAK